MDIFRRWWIYISEVFLPGSRILISILIYVGVMFLYQALINRIPLVLTLDLVPGVTTLVLMFLYFRIQDEFKDRETDRRFFPDRPVPAGRVSLHDLATLMWVNFALLFLINIMWGRAIGMFLFFLGFSILMHKWFFMEKKISRNRLLALATHGPFGFVANLFVVAIYTNRYEIPLLSLNTALATFWFALTGFYWDVARKTRAPHEEMEGYQTYSIMLGHSWSSVLAFSFILAQAVMLIWLPISRWYGLFFVLCVLSLAAIFVNFILKPERGSKHLQLATEIFTSMVICGIILDLSFSRGIGWTR
jgi:4-hydroxybenzoate polyprenyltransferase